MRITYVGYGDFYRYAGMKQLYHFAQGVCRQGHSAQILIAGSVETVHGMHGPSLAEIVELRFSGPLLSRAVGRRVKKFQPDIIHVWTPRHIPALASWHLHKQTGATVILDHEDDERYLAKIYLKSQSNRYHGLIELGVRPMRQVKRCVLPWLSPLSSDGSARRMAQDNLSSSLLRPLVAAHTAISPALVAHVQRGWPGAPVYLLFPGANLALFSPQVNGNAVRQKYGLEPEQLLLMYTGTLSLGIVDYFLKMLQSVVATIPNAFLVLVGNDEYQRDAQAIIDQTGLRKHIALTGLISHAEVPEYLAAADVLLQHPIDIGNDLRLPAKLPEYLAMGKPVVTYSQGIGSIFDHGVNAMILASDDPEEMSRLVLVLLQDAALSNRLRQGSRALVERMFDWKSNCATLINIYERTLRVTNH